jgi:hypothetical protein
MLAPPGDGSRDAAANGTGRRFAKRATIDWHRGTSEDDALDKKAKTPKKPKQNKPKGAADKAK